MSKKALLLSTFCLSLSANEFTFLTESLKLENSLLDLNSSLTLFGSKYYIHSQKGEYDLESKKAHFSEGVCGIKGDNLYIISDSINLDIASREADFQNLFLYNSSDSIWLNSKEANLSKSKYALSHTVTSSCNVESPIWSFKFEKGEYDSKEKWVDIYNSKFYLKDMPLLYLPYFGFSTNRERSSGLLRPHFGLSADEGLFYSQPIFIAPYENWDIELTPQFRTDRGVGIYSHFRLVDSLYSKLDLITGYFREKNSYREEFKLKNSSHYGSEIFYRNSKLLSREYNFEDGLYFEGIWLNDIDYLNLKKSINYSADTTNLITSRLNYYLKRDMDYFGLYSKYFIDTSKDSNVDTVQNLPTMHYHKFFQNFLSSDIIYSMDMKYRNLYRERGSSAREFEMLVPFNFYYTLFDEFLTFKVSENLYFRDIAYSNSESQSGYIFKNYHNLSLFSELIKPYSSFTHSMLFKLAYIVPSFENGELDLDEYLSESISQKERVEFEFMQSIFEDRADFIHRVNQALFLDGENSFSNLENELIYNINHNLKLYNTLYYSIESERLAQISTSLDIEKELYSAIINHFYSKESESNFLNLDLSSDIDNYSIFGNLAYEFRDNFLKGWEAGFSYEQKCWDYRVSYKEELNPILTQNGADSVENKVIYFQINLVPFGGIKQKIHKQNRG